MPPTAANIAADLAIAMHRGYIRADEQLPSQSHLCKAYEVSIATANAALAKLAAAGLTYVKQGRGTYAVDLNHDLFRPSPVVDLLTAAGICRSVASTNWPEKNFERVASVEVGGSKFYDTAWYDPEKHAPPRLVPVSALIGLDRHLLRFMAEQFVLAARRLVGAGGELADTDTHTVEAARSIVRDGGRRPDKQPPIASLGGPTSPEEDVVLRIWPERGLPPGPDDPPF
jgi:DNA-binding transcriptional MocR family regulator